MILWIPFYSDIFKDLFRKYQQQICEKRFLISQSQWVRSVSIFAANIHSLSEDDKEEKTPFIQIPKESHCYLNILFVSKSENIIEILWWSVALRTTFCIFIQLSYLSEQIIRGDKLKRWGNNGSRWEATEWYKHIPEKHQQLGKHKMHSTKPCNSKWAVVNDGDDGGDNDDEAAVNKIWMMESF